MPSALPFAQWTYREADAALREALLAPFADDAARGAAPTAHAETAAMLAGDHWMDGAGWVGPGAMADGTLAPEVRAQILRQFTPVDAVGEVADNLGAGLTGTEPAMDLAADDPPEGADDVTALEQRRQDALDALTAWWDDALVALAAAQAARRLAGYARAPLRVVPSPDAYAERQGADGRPEVVLRTGLAFRDALALLTVEAPPPEVAAVIRHPRTRQRAAVVRADRTENDQTVRVVQLWTVDTATGATLVRELAENDADRDEARPAPPTFAVDLGGRLPVTEARLPLGRPLITEAVRRQQKRLNYFESANVRGVETAGFPERTISNAEPFGEWLPHAPPYLTQTQTVQAPGGPVTYYLHRTTPTLGAATITELTGLPIKDADGQVTGYTTPAVDRKEPTDPALIGTAADRARFTILRDCRMGHLATDGTVQLSGIAYEQSRAVFHRYLLSVRGAGVEMPVRDLLAAAVAWAILLSQPTDPLAAALRTGLAPGGPWRLVVTATVDAGPVSSETRRQLDEAVQAGTRDHASALAEQGVEDPRAERAAIDADPLRRLAVLARVAAGEAALREAGRTSPDQIRRALEWTNVDAGLLDALEIQGADAPAAAVPPAPSLADERDALDAEPVSAAPDPAAFAAVVAEAVLAAIEPRLAALEARPAAPTPPPTINVTPVIQMPAARTPAEVGATIAEARAALRPTAA